jgi:hypothetical protein
MSFLFLKGQGYVDFCCYALYRLTFEADLYLACFELTLSIAKQFVLSGFNQDEVLL